MLLSSGLWWVVSLPLPLTLAVVVEPTPLLPGPALPWTLLWRHISSTAIRHVPRPTTAISAALVSTASLYSRVLSSGKGPATVGITTIEIASTSCRTPSSRSSELFPARPVHIHSPLA